MENLFFDLIKKIIANYPGIALCKNIDLVYMSCNNYTARIIGFKNPDHCAGNTDYDIKCEAAKYAEKFRNQDRKVITSKSSATYLDINHYKNGIRILSTKRKALQDYDGKVVGIFCYGSDITLNFSKKMGYLKHIEAIDFSDLKRARSFELIDKFNPNLSRKENTSLFYMLRNKSKREISILTGQSIQEIHKSIENIKIILNCNNIKQVIEKCIHLGYLDMLLKEFIVNNSHSFL